MINEENCSASLDLISLKLEIPAFYSTTEEPFESPASTQQPNFADFTGDQLENDQGPTIIGNSDVAQVSTTIVDESHSGSTPSNSQEGTLESHAPAVDTSSPHQVTTSSFGVHTNEVSSTTTKTQTTASTQNTSVETTISEIATSKGSTSKSTLTESSTVSQANTASASETTSNSTDETVSTLNTLVSKTTQIVGTHRYSTENQQPSSTNAKDSESSQSTIRSQSIIVDSTVSTKNAITTLPPITENPRNTANDSQDSQTTLSGNEEPTNISSQPSTPTENPTTIRVAITTTSHVSNESEQSRENISQKSTISDAGVVISTSKTQTNQKPSTGPSLSEITTEKKPTSTTYHTPASSDGTLVEDSSSESTILVNTHGITSETSTKVFTTDTSPNEKTTKEKSTTNIYYTTNASREAPEEVTFQPSTIIEMTQKVTSTTPPEDHQNPSLGPSSNETATTETDNQTTSRTTATSSKPSTVPVKTPETVNQKEENNSSTTGEKTTIIIPTTNQTTDPKSIHTTTLSNKYGVNISTTTTDLNFTTSNEHRDENIVSMQMQNSQADKIVIGLLITILVISTMMCFFALYKKKRTDEAINRQKSNRGHASIRSRSSITCVNLENGPRTIEIVHPHSMPDD
ncbi:hypothetical protein RF11_01762 [Thelohanellus kitauei]|uniref:Uncharacterized protein n=1 Tax=Thelohanellus kitauei TaxID=669202 RepID=A0A0C2MKI4_THEKT|nr:hypothetical protein RF11_01762 [Thelohanellus kitauei]